jgi:BirA family biotin operon repressor/biotin-[acetyl-CoA-carboxylase] ligase
VEVNKDLDEAVVRRTLAGRPVRVYPALLSTEAEATAWARSGAPSGAVVTAGYQVSPRGRAGLPWQVELGRGLGFSMVLRPQLTAEREGWPYVAACVALADALADALAETGVDRSADAPRGTGEAAGRPPTRLVWPDQVCSDTGEQLAAVGITAQVGPTGTEWVVVTVLFGTAEPPRTPLLGTAVTAVERRLAQRPEQVLEAYRPHSVTLGRRVLARMIPMGPAGPQLTGVAVDVLLDGALVLLTDRGHRIAVRPQNLGILESAGD